LFDADLVFVAGNGQLANGSENPQAVQVALSPSARSPSTIGSPGRGGFGQEESPPPASLEFPLDSFDLGIDDALAGARLSRLGEAVGLSVLDQLFREWPPTAGKQERDAQPQSENSGREEAAAAVEVSSESRGGEESVVVEQPEQPLFDDGPLMDSATTPDSTDSPGAALRGGSKPLMVDRTENGASTVTSNEKLLAGLAVIALDYPLGREFRAKQRRRPSL
jgi:hypothetical protein